MNSALLWRRDAGSAGIKTAPSTALCKEDYSFLLGKPNNTVNGN